MERIESRSSSKKITTVTEVQPEQHHGRVGSFFKGVFRRSSKDHDNTIITARSIEPPDINQLKRSQSVPNSAVTQPALIPESKKEPEITITETVIGETAPDETPTAVSRRAVCEAQLEKSAEALNKAIAKVANFRVPDAISLQNVEVDNIARTTRNIETAIDAFIDSRQYKLAADKRATWKSCAANIYKAFYPYVKNTMSEISDVLPSPYSLAVSGVLFVLQKVYDAVKLAEDIENAISELSTIMHRVEVTEGFNDILDESQLDEVYCDALTLSTCVTEYLTLSVMHVDHNTGIGFASVRFQVAKKKLEDAATRYKDSMGYLTVSMTAELLHHDKDEKREKTLDWVWKGDYWSKHKNLRDRRVPNTGKGFLEDKRIQEWRTGPGNPFILCLGIPGCGKSFITSILIDYLRRFTNSRSREKVGLVYFYFDNHNPNYQTSDDFVRSILKQLLYHEQLPFPKSLTNLYDAVTKQGQTAEPDTDKLVSILGECFRAFDKVFVAVDAFDECAEEMRPAVMAHLRKLPQTHLRLFLTGRNGVFDTRNLRDDEELQTWLSQTLTIPMKASDEDIYLYLTNELEKKAKSLVPALKDQIISSIREQAAGQILLAQCQLNYVLHFLSQPRKLVEALQHLPKTIDEVYNDVLRRIGSDNPDKSADKELAMRTLAWIFYTADRPGARPLKMGELQDLLVTEPGDTQFQSQYRSVPSDIIAACQSLVILRDEQNDTVGFSHFTIHEFLRNCKELPSKSYIAKVCLTFLSFPEFETGMSGTPEAQNERMEKFKAGPFIAGFLGFFLKEVEDDIEIQKAVIDLLGRESRFRAIIEMEFAELGNRYASIAAITFEDGREHIESQKIILYLARQGLAKTLASFVDGKFGAILQEHRDIEAKSNHDRTALHYAASYYQPEIVRLLLDHKANVNAKAKEGETPLLAGINNHEISLLILEHGPDVNATWDNGVSALHKAAGIGDKELIKKILEMGGNINKQGHCGLTPVQFSTFQSNVEVVKLLVDHGADILLTADNGMNALHFAVYHSVFDIIWFLSDATWDRLQREHHADGMNIESFIGQKQEAESIDRIEFLSRMCRAFDRDHLYPYLTAEELWIAGTYDRAVEYYHLVLEKDPANASVLTIDALQHQWFNDDDDDIIGPYTCDDCQNPVVGFRWCCKQCENWDLCSECYVKPTWPNHESKTIHEVIRIPREGWKWAARNVEKLEPEKQSENDSKFEINGDAKIEKNGDSKVGSNIDTKLESKMESIELKIDAKVESKGEQKMD